MTVGTVSGVALSGGEANASYTSTVLPMGSYTITATFTANANFNTSSGSAALSVGKANSATVANDQTAVYGDPTTTLSATVSNASNSAPLDAGNVDFAIKQGATTLATNSGALNTSNGQASATLNLTPMANFPAGGYTIEASYGPTANFTASSDTATLTIVKANTAFVNGSVAGDATYGESTGTLQARLQRTNGNNGWVRVVFRVNGVVVCGGGPACLPADRQRRLGDPHRHRSAGRAER